MLAEAMQHKFSGEWGMILQGGRPLYALYLKEVLGAVGGIEDLGYMRAFGVAGIGVVCTLVYRSLSQTELPRWIVIAGALLFGLIPSYQVYAAWAVASFYPWACVLAAVSFSLCDGISDLRSEWLRFCGSLLLLTASMAIYQPAAMVFWDFAAIAWLLRANIPSVRSILASVAVMFSSLTVGYGLVKIVPLVLLGSSNSFPRTVLVKDYFGKVHWFFKEPLVNSLNIFSIQPSAKLALLVIVMMVVGFFLFCRRDLRRTLVYIGIAILLVPASYVPNLVIAENWASYRTQVGLTGLIFIFSIIAFVGWMQFFKACRLIPVLCLIAITGGALAANRNVTAGFAVPQAIEYGLIESALLRTQFNPDDRICFNLPQKAKAFAKIVRYDEFGTLSSMANWVPFQMAWLILKKHHSNYANLFAVDYSNPKIGTIIPDYKKIDLDEILIH